MNGNINELVLNKIISKSSTVYSIFHLRINNPEELSSHLDVRKYFLFHKNIFQSGNMKISVIHKLNWNISSSGTLKSNNFVLSNTTNTELLVRKILILTLS